jgi:rubrerythrin
VDASVIAGAIMGALIIGFLLFIRFKDLPQPAPISPYRHLDERKAAIYENLRDLQFEYRLNKLSDEDYQASKLGLQKELARVLEETDRINAGMGQPVKVAAPKKPACAKCGAQFEKSPKFCPECGAAQ